MLNNDTPCLIILFCRPVRKRDIGFYECQISTVNKMSFRVYLKVIGKFIKYVHDFNSLRKKCKNINSLFEPR
jgi:hypothetical protein